MDELSSADTARPASLLLCAGAVAGASELAVNPRHAAARRTAQVPVAGLVFALVLTLVGCASGPAPRSSTGASSGGGGTPSGASSGQASSSANAATPPVRSGPAPAGERDGPDPNPPPNLVAVPDAEPVLEPIRIGGPNKPYEVRGRDYVPITRDEPFTERGLASWYGRKFHGRRTANGEIYNMYAMTAAHPTLPLPSFVVVRNPANQREVVVRVNDRGPFHPGRIIDLSYTAALKLGVLRGVAPVEVERITFEAIRTGAWRRPGAEPDRALAAITPAAPAPVAALTPGPATQTPLATSASTTPTPRTLPLQQPGPAVAGGEPDALMAWIAASPGGSGAAARAATSAPSTLPEPPPAGASVPTVTGRGFWVQLGAFKERAGADNFHRRVVADLDWLGPLLAVFGESSTFRLQAGPYSSHDEARSVAQRIRSVLKLVPVVVEKR